MSYSFPHVIIELQLELRSRLGTVMSWVPCFYPVSLMHSQKADNNSNWTLEFSGDYTKMCIFANKKEHLFFKLCDGRTSFCWTWEAGLSGPKKYFLLRYLVVMWDDLSCLTALSFWGVLLYCSKSSQHVRWMLCRNTNVTFASALTYCTVVDIFYLYHHTFHLCMTMNILYMLVWWEYYLTRKLRVFLSSPGILILEERHKVPNLMAVTKQGTKTVTLVIRRHTGPRFRKIMCFYKGSRVCKRREIWDGSTLLRL